MLKNNYLFYSSYLKNRNFKTKSIMIARCKKSYLIGPKIDSLFYEKSFYKRIKSNSIYSKKIYKKLSKRKINFLIEKYASKLKSNQVFEIYKDGEIEIHTITKVPGDDNEKK